MDMVIKNSRSRSRPRKSKLSRVNQQSSENRENQAEDGSTDENSHLVGGDAPNMTSVDLDHEEYSLTRWNSLLKRTNEMKSMAINCDPLSTHAVGELILAGLDEITVFIKSNKSPSVPDFKEVDQKMQAINELVGQAIDSYLMQRRGGKGSMYRRLFFVTKTIAACAILAGVMAIFSNWYPSWFLIFQQT